MAIANGILKRGYSIRILIDPQCNRLEEIRKTAEFPIDYFTVRNRLDMTAVKTLRQMLRDYIPDVIYAPTNRTLSASLLSIRKLPFPVKVAGYRGTMGHVKRYNPASWLTYLNPRLSHIICVSEAVRQHLIKDVKIPADKLTTIHKGHDVSWYQNPGNADLVELGVPADAVVVGFAGNMRPVKGVDVLVRALDYIPEEIKIHLLLIGEVRDNKLADLMRRAEYKKRITLTGYRADAPALINACDIFVMPSVEREGLPRAVIEAMAMKLPVIVSDVGGMPEQVVNNECGFVVPPRNEKALAEAIIKLAGSPELRAEFGEAALIRINTQFDVNTTIDKMCSLFNMCYSRG